MKYVICLLIGYAFGLIQTGYYYGRAHGVDIRKTGSGNVGTTNALRTMGKKAGLIVMIGDILKCMAAIGVTWLIFGRNNPDLDYLFRIITGFGCILGHNYPFYMGFKGGKGVACTAGLIISTSIPMTLFGIVLFFGTVTVTHYVSLASLLVGIMFFVGSIILGQTGALHLSGGPLTAYYVMAFLVMVQIFFSHRANIKRLLSGTERKTYVFKKPS